MATRKNAWLFYELCAWHYTPFVLLFMCAASNFCFLCHEIQKLGSIQLYTDQDTHKNNSYTPEEYLDLSRWRPQKCSKDSDEKKPLTIRRTLVMNSILYEISAIFAPSRNLYQCKMDTGWRLTNTGILLGSYNISYFSNCLPYKYCRDEIAHAPSKKTQPLLCWH